MVEHHSFLPELLITTCDLISITHSSVLARFVDCVVASTMSVCFVKPRHCLFQNLELNPRIETTSWPRLERKTNHLFPSPYFQKHNRQIHHFNLAIPPKHPSTMSKLASQSEPLIDFTQPAFISKSPATSLHSNHNSSHMHSSP